MNKVVYVCVFDNNYTEYTIQSYRQLYTVCIESNYVIVYYQIYLLVNY